MALENKKIHVISFNIPYPPNYGGVIDVYYKLKHLKQFGYNVILHCYQYDREPAKELAQVCSQVYYYERRLRNIHFLSVTPFIVKTRINKKLVANLKKDNYPVLLEGLHCSFLLKEKSLKGRKFYLRAHNVEHHYYQNLFLSETSVKDLIYYLFESMKLKFYEPVVKKADKVLALSPSDYQYFKNTYGDKVELILPFHANDIINIKTGKGEYILFHGNLAVEENSNALLYLLKNVFVYQPFKVIIAGNHPSSELVKEINKLKNTELVQNPSDEKMDELIQNAHINLLYTFQATGMKLKLINSLFHGRFCLVNSLMVENTGLEACCEIEDKPEMIIVKINELMSKEFSLDIIDSRINYLQEFSNQINIEKLTQVLEE